MTRNKKVERILTPKAKHLDCRKVRGGKNILWHARLGSDYFSYELMRGDLKRICGAGNTADNAIKDFQAQFRRVLHVRKTDHLETEVRKDFPEYSWMKK